MIFGLAIWYVKMKYFAEAWSHRSRGPEVTLKRQYFFQSAVESLFLIGFWWNKRHKKGEYASFQSRVVKNDVPLTVFVLFPVYKNDVINSFKCK